MLKEAVGASFWYDALMKNDGSFAIIVRQNKILLVLLPDWANFGNHWNLPGGVVNQDETIKDAAAREVLEETGIACDVGDIFMKTENDKYKITIFIAKYVKGEISIQEKEVQEARWFSKEEIKGLPLAYDTKAILLDYFNSKSKF